MKITPSSAAATSSSSQVTRIFGVAFSKAAGKAWTPIQNDVKPSQNTKKSVGDKQTVPTAVSKTNLFVSKKERKSTSSHAEWVPKDSMMGMCSTSHSGSHRAVQSSHQEPHHVTSERVHQPNCRRRNRSRSKQTTRVSDATEPNATRDSQFTQLSRRSKAVPVCVDTGKMSLWRWSVFGGFDADFPASKVNHVVSLQDHDQLNQKLRDEALLSFRS
jgi:hypothetical protein